MEFIFENWGKLLVAISAALNLFSAIAAITKTPRDDKIARVGKDMVKRFLSLK